MNNVDENYKKNALILVVDDTPLNLQLVGNIFKFEGYRFEFAKNGNEALEKVRTLKPKLIILDIMMFELDGYEVCRILKESDETCDIPIVFLTSRSDKDDIIKGLNAGAVDFITKPFSPDELIARVNTHLNLLQAKEKLIEQNESLFSLTKELLKAKTENEEKNKELEKLNIMLLEKANALQELNSTRDKFFSIIAHDLKGPFAGFLGLTDILANNSEQLQSKEISTISSRIYDSARSMNGLLDNLLEWAKLQKVNMPITNKYFDIKSVVVQVEDVLKNQLEQKNLEIVYDMEDTSIAYSDDRIVGTMIRNIISNAVKFSKPGGRIVASACVQPDNYINISISDNGIGMSEEVKNTVFDLTKKLSMPGTDSESGAGVGLSLCQELAEKISTKIEFYSEINKGSKFYFKLPLSAGKQSLIMESL